MKPERNSPGDFSRQWTERSSNFPASLIWDAFVIFGIHYFAGFVHFALDRHSIGC